MKWYLNIMYVQLITFIDFPAVMFGRSEGSKQKPHSPSQKACKGRREEPANFWYL